MRSFKRGLVVATGVLITFACGSTHHAHRSENTAGAAAGGSPDAVDESAGAAGGGALEIPPPVACGFQSCKAIVVGGTAVAPCCSNPATGTCGADVSALVPTLGCQPLTREGALDRSCPSSTGAVGGGLPLPPAPGCCNARTRQCGYWISNLGGLLPFAPGCIDSAGLGGGTPQACGDGEPVAGGAGGNAGGGDSGGASVAGAGGAAGAPGLETAGASESGGGGR
jgi:hypothetical protein